MRLGQTAHLVRASLKHPPHVVVREVSRRLRSRGTAVFVRERDARRPTYGARPRGSSLARIVERLPAVESGRAGEALAGVCDRYLEHRFDLLGSGWVRVAYGEQPRGLMGVMFAPGETVEPDSAGRWLEGRINDANLAIARQVWGLVDSDYQPIDWSADFKSGYRWPTTTWFQDVRYGDVRGVDVKVPWELARGQHLPRLALAYGAAVAGAKGFSAAHVYQREVRNQILDFVATNPPRYGVNWRCTMDVGIRIANWLVAYDILRAYGAEFDADFDSVLAGSVADHGRYIVNNLEWHPVFRSNHYLADLAGLAFVSAYLESQSAPVDRWLALAARELAAETALQFHDDGTNAEASTCYHRLSTEIVVYATAVLSSAFAVRRLVPPGWVTGRTALLRAVASASHFTGWITKNGGNVPEIGDNDSGRFVQLAPLPHRLTWGEARTEFANLEGDTDISHSEPYWLQDHLDHSHLLVAADALRDTQPGTALSEVISSEVVHLNSGGLTVDQLNDFRDRGRGLREPRVPVTPIPGREAVATPATNAGDDLYIRSCWRLVPDGPSLTTGLRIAAFPDFGLFVFRSDRLFLVVRCGPGGQSGSGGHSHNDQLGLEVEIDGQPWFRDPGTYLYTPMPEIRNAYRSARSHLVPRHPTAEPGDLGVGLFVLPDRARSRCLWFGETGFGGVHFGYGLPTLREIHLTETSVDVHDAVPTQPGLEEDSAGEVPRACEARHSGMTMFSDPSSLALRFGPEVAYSPGYGQVERGSLKGAVGVG